MEQAANRATILVVDDERGPRDSLRMILEPIHRVVPCGTGNEALERLRREPVDLVTIDLNMPGMKGQELMRTVRSEFPEVEVIVITGCGSLESATEGIRYGIADYLEKPFDVVQVGGAVTRALTRRRARTRLSRFLEALGSVVGREHDVTALLDDVHQSQKLRGRLAGLFDSHVADPTSAAAGETLRALEFLEVLAETIERQDVFMRGHARRVAVYTGLLAEDLQLPAPERHRLRIASFLHDIGKVGVPNELLLRSGALDPTERRRVEQHPAIGARLLEPLDIPSAIGLAVRHHHEWWDGTGYPDGLAGERIPLVARIIGVADAFDAMTCARPYRPALSRDLVKSELQRFSGVQFDPLLVKQLLRLLESGACDLDPEWLAEALAAPRADAAALAG
jgi:response regulator RpfG family c-di-GMP phosphodiesterase